MNPLVARAESDVKAHGWHVVTVGADETNPEFAYTVGLSRSFSHAEVLVIGLPAKTAHALLNVVGSEVASGAAFGTGVPYVGLLTKYACEFRAVPTSLFPDYFGIAIGFYRSDPFSAIQLVWPDRSGRFPWDTAVSESFRKSQPVLS